MVRGKRRYNQKQGFWKYSVPKQGVIGITHEWLGNKSKMYRRPEAEASERVVG